jgi:hypothetical protein
MPSDVVTYLSGGPGVYDDSRRSLTHGQPRLETPLRSSESAPGAPEVREEMCA